MWTNIWQPFLIFLFSNILSIQGYIYIQFERSGGFAGITSKVEIDSNSLSSDEMEKLERLINDSDFFEFHKNDSIEGEMSDQFYYKLTIEYKNESHTVELSDSAVPESFRPLLNYLNQKARSRKKK